MRPSREEGGYKAIGIEIDRVDCQGWINRLGHMQSEVMAKAGGHSHSTGRSGDRFTSLTLKACM